VAVERNSGFWPPEPITEFRSELEAGKEMELE
jgi:hypothetical protein